MYSDLTSLEQQVTRCFRSLKPILTGLFLLICSNIHLLGLLPNAQFGQTWHLMTQLRSGERTGSRLLWSLPLPYCLATWFHSLSSVMVSAEPFSDRSRPMPCSYGALPNHWHATVVGSRQSAISWTCVHWHSWMVDYNCFTKLKIHSQVVGVYSNYSIYEMKTSLKDIMLSVCSISHICSNWCGSVCCIHMCTQLCATLQCTQICACLCVYAQCTSLRCDVTRPSWFRFRFLPLANEEW